VSSTATPPTAYDRAPAQRTNTLAIVAFVLAFVVSLGAVICGHIALSQIRRTGEQGRAFAIWALVLGYAGLVFGVLFTAVFLVLLANAPLPSTF
jgi:peptidyl-prolyl cis-trans isomerase B (cyclophilin B)